MTRHTTDETTHDTIDTASATAGAPRPVIDRVEAALRALDGQSSGLGPVPATDTGWIAWSAALWLISARRAGWWRVLLADDQRTYALHPLHRRAAVMAHRRERDNARFWRETVQDWQARTEHRPTSDAAGALSNWWELGVAE